MKHQQQKAWVVTVDMGYGHQRATYPLQDIAYGKIITANTYHGIPQSDRDVWLKSQHFYEAISRFKQVPVIGEAVFNLYDHLQEILPFYPKRDLSAPTLSLRQIVGMIRKGWGKHLIQLLGRKRKLPLVTSFFVTAHMAEIHGYEGEIYCIITDTDMSRSWVALDPAKSRLHYFAPTYRVVERLKLYGVPDERIYLTGFPLPKENSGGKADLPLIKHDLLERFPNLDTNRRFAKQYGRMVKEHLGSLPPRRSNHPFTLMFAVGGAGAQSGLAVTILKSLYESLHRKNMRFILVAGIRPDVRDTFTNDVKEIGLGALLGSTIEVLYMKKKLEYFQLFNKKLRTTDVLWTKPSELCFYTALGIPIIMAPPVGSQEKFNKLWLKSMASGISQQDPQYTNEWLDDWLESGWLAEAAMQGFLEAPRYGTYNIETILNQHPERMKEVRTVLQY